MTRPAIELIRSPELTGCAPYAYAAVASDVSRLIFTAGACPLDADGTVTPVGDITGQAELVMLPGHAARRARSQVRALQAG